MWARAALFGLRMAPRRRASDVETLRHSAAGSTRLFGHPTECRAAGAACDSLPPHSPIGRVFVEAHANRLYSFFQPSMFRTFQPLREADGAGDRFGDELRVAFRAIQAHSV
jgi:hypothetical protein